MICREFATLELTIVSQRVIFLIGVIGTLSGLRRLSSACITWLRIAGGDRWNGAREGSQN